MIVASDDLCKSMQSFKPYTAKQLLELLKKENAKTSLEQLAFYKRAHHQEKSYQVWEAGYRPTDPVRGNDKIKVDCIHHNPLKRGYVDEDVHWRYKAVPKIIWA